MLADVYSFPYLSYLSYKQIRCGQHAIAAASPVQAHVYHALAGIGQQLVGQPQLVSYLIEAFEARQDRPLLDVQHWLKVIVAISESDSVSGTLLFTICIFNLLAAHAPHSNRGAMRL